MSFWIMDALFKYKWTFELWVDFGIMDELLGLGMTKSNSQLLGLGKGMKTKFPTVKKGKWHIISQKTWECNWEFWMPLPLLSLYWACLAAQIHIWHSAWIDLSYLRQTQKGCIEHTLFPNTFWNIFELSKEYREKLGTGNPAHTWNLVFNQKSQFLTM